MECQHVRAFGETGREPRESLGQTVRAGRCDDLDRLICELQAGNGLAVGERSAQNIDRVELPRPREAGGGGQPRIDRTGRKRSHPITQVDGSVIRRRAALHERIDIVGRRGRKLLGRFVERHHGVERNHLKPIGVARCAGAMKQAKTIGQIDGVAGPGPAGRTSLAQSQPPGRSRARRTARHKTS